MNMKNNNLNEDFAGDFELLRIEKLIEEREAYEKEFLSLEPSTAELDYQIFQWWKINVSVNLYQNHIEGTELLNNKDKSSFQASGKFSSYMNLPNDWTIQLSGQYWAPWLDLQTEMDANYWVDLAVKKDIFNRRGTVNLRISDVLCTGGWGHRTYDNQMNRVVKAKRLSPTITLGFSWKINNGLKQKPQQQEEEGSDESTIY